jgi:hypothetical protein
VLRSGKFWGQKILGPLKISLEMAREVICPQKSNFKISGTLIVIPIRMKKEQVLVL